MVTVRKPKHPVCPLCSAWMLIKPALPNDWLRCVSCGFMEEVVKTITIPKGEK